MATITELRPSVDLMRAARASFVHGALKDERWSVRQAAMRIGVSHTALGSRLNGTTSFLAEELEAIAVLLKRDPVEFYAEYLAAGVDPEGAANQRQKDYNAAGSTGEVISLADHRMKMGA